MPDVRRNVRGEETQREILDATFQLVQRLGYDRTTIGGIVKATGKPASSIYHLFGSKDALIARALEHSYPDQPVALRWHPYELGTPPYEQLVDNLAVLLGPEIGADSVRAGIMMALEGSAAGRGIHGPFVTRRAKALEAFRRWWVAYFAENGTVAASTQRGAGNSNSAARRMAYLVLWILDGHFVGDRDQTGVDTEGKARLVARSLLAAAHGQYAWGQHETIPELADADRASLCDTDLLLSVTRRLVAEYSYDGATIARICEASGLKRSSVYWRYEDKDQLVYAAVSEQFLNVLGRVDAMTQRLSREEREAIPDWQYVAHSLGGDLAYLQSRLLVDPDLMRAGLLMAVQRWEPPTAGGEALKSGSRAIDAQLAEWLEGLGLGEAQQATRAAWLFTRLRMGIIVSRVLAEDGPVFAASASTEIVEALLARD